MYINRVFSRVLISCGPGNPTLAHDGKAKNKVAV